MLGWNASTSSSGGRRLERSASDPGNRVFPSLRDQHLQDIRAGNQEARRIRQRQQEEERQRQIYEQARLLRQQHQSREQSDRNSIGSGNSVTSLPSYRSRDPYPPPSYTSQSNLAYTSQTNAAYNSQHIQYVTRRQNGQQAERGREGYGSYGQQQGNPTAEPSGSYESRNGRHY